MATSGASSTGTSAGGASAGAGVAGARSNCQPTGKKELCDGIDNDCDAATPDLCPSGCSGFVMGGAGHMVCSKAVVLSSAQLTCLNQSMYMASPNSVSENDEILARAARLGAFVWLGAQDEQSNHSLKWPNGAVVATNGVPNDGVYTDFASGEPAVLSGQNCLHMATEGADAGTWSSVTCTAVATFVCEPLFWRRGAEL